MRLYLVRHGIAINRTEPNCPPEPERHLTEKGIEKSREVAGGLKSLGLAPDLMLSSPFLRAVQTAEIFCEALEYPKDRIRRTDALIPSAKPAAILQELGKTRSKEIMCFGHAPHLDEVIAEALGAGGAFTALKKSGVACLEFEQAPLRRGLLLWLCSPKLLRSFGK